MEHTRNPRKRSVRYRASASHPKGRNPHGAWKVIIGGKNSGIVETNYGSRKILEESRQAYRQARKLVKVK